jgi:hypothetical protein
MIPWILSETPQPKREAVITIGSCQLSVSERQDLGTRWQWIMFSCGEFSDSPLDECLETWPKRAVQLARQAVRELDQRLQELDK